MRLRRALAAVAAAAAALVAVASIMHNVARYKLVVPRPKEESTK
jgi:hypothetical protein